MARKHPTTVYLTPDQRARLRALHERTMVPEAVYIREGIEWVLTRHEQAQAPSPRRKAE